MLDRLDKVIRQYRHDLAPMSMEDRRFWNCPHSVVECVGGAYCADGSSWGRYRCRNCIGCWWLEADYTGKKPWEKDQPLSGVGEEAAGIGDS